ncbi:carboxyl-terminal processing protease CtpA [Planktothrix agardhii]|jgi:carboxyl-terminal processing protease|uniref:Carboxyl-terminal-processing protease n=2 Tax=Planktothrix agardhii TaxID=1160 RepID=A0A073CFR4_PLAA1|nr:carboxyl-terminal processing protease CtpA [Planktothrix agardhii]BBD55505.1 carboxyl-terminal processing protease [Planktothrix agardhii NIES-204]KEI66523.1 CtpA [Planktothrix agardhii NIVA-CYA 126/8]MBG0748321.1 PDZ domain-containing protein [Planktothrix agardhii KL2]MCB8751665.1 PDZ domain-containing protein [Planktothrix agardhii 1810]MCB8760647.1 PDZ domain-containing protein [Planktothrix agardhii 1813]
MQKRVFPIAFLIILQVCLTWITWTTPVLALTEDQKIFSESWRIINRSYVDESFNHQNWWSIREKLIRQPFKSREDTYSAIEKMLATLDDPFTRLLRPDQYRSLQVNTSGELMGVGLQISQDGETGNLTVIAPIDDSPAERAGIQPQDQIVKIDGFSTSELTLDESAARMRGLRGSQVTLTVLRNSNKTTEDIILVRDRIALNPVITELRSDLKDTPLGYIRLNQFNANATEEVAQGIQSLEKKGAKAYILDLRNNPGGLLQSGIEIARLWLDEGTIVYTVNRQGLLGSFEAVGSALTQAPLVVLVNPGTASASEILAGALHDNHRATLVGEKTFGKGLIQSLFDLSDGSGLAVTVAKYETPNHTDINKLGIMPDRVIPSEPLLRNQVATEADHQYQTALELLSSQLVVAQN